MGRKMMGRTTAVRLDANRERYAWYKEHGICVQCGRGWAAPARVRCPDCLRKGRLAAKKYDPDGTKHNAQGKLRRDARKAAGLCIDCGKPTDGTITQCKRCAERRRESVHAYKLRQKIREGKA